MASNQTPLGSPPLTLGHTSETLFLLVEDPPSTRVFRAFPWAIQSMTVRRNANLPTTAEVTIGLGKAPDGAYPQELLRDWQLVDKNEHPANPWTMLTGGRRCQIRTLRSEPGDDWVLCDAYIGKVVLGWSGNSRDATRTLKLFATSVITAADRELPQFLIGQWRRSYKAEKLLLQNFATVPPPNPNCNECVRSVAQLCVFNPGGRGNCHVTPLAFGDDKPVYVFCDPDDEFARPWNVARMLRYIQWAGLQPGLTPPANPNDALAVYDTPAKARDSSSWTAHPPINWTNAALAFQRNYDLPSGNLFHGPNLDDLVAPYLDRFDQTAGDPQGAALLRQLSDVGLHCMSVLEAFTLVCDQAGLVWYDDCEVGTDNLVHTFLRFVVRGDRDIGETPAGNAGSVQDGVPPGAPPATPGAHPATTRGVYLNVASDRIDDTGKSVLTLLKETAATEGELAFDEDHVRRTLLLVGDPVSYEATTPALLPGWPYNAASYWDPDPTEQADVNAAFTYITSGPGASLYGKTGLAPEKSNFGRYWVLNEDGKHWFHRADFKRATGRWSQDSEWEPFKWRSGISLREMETRGDDYWPLRRRKFLAPQATILGRPDDAFVQVQFTTNGPWYSAQELSLQVAIDVNRAALYISNPDLSSVTDPTGTYNYVKQYLLKQLSVRVTCLLEGDDALLAWALPKEADKSTIGWGEAQNRRGKLPRTLRYNPVTDGDAIANSFYIRNAALAAVITDKNRDASQEAVRIAGRTRDDRAIVRISGSASIPWLWRDGFGPVAGYRVGDELLGIKTGLAETFVDFLNGRQATAPLPRINGITYHYGEDGSQSTTLSIEDESTAAREAAIAPPPLIRDVPFERRGG